MSENKMTTKPKGKTYTETRKQEMLDARLTRIAAHHLNIPTLKAQHSDRLDFHDVGVVSLKAALEAAYNAGRDKGRNERPGN